ncbi:dimethylaniline monooxygenase 2 [Cordyceps fumosorosea ARSEF 2679]|uniref:Dimethylaniline monooxygenase 2 n=1 Tax=Cordyceps fumosorosea (strain ARSEF 2679) TaxID=1081104 RepID=A0A168B317_CORFA|nr:dimethylaniline monooxygenase 2 [Cordyceps fumosorosea ARSEF 2679]OAA69551.1 dimethylaniline monooxygenase 2 [Cordyceps fumosorosea ARSEF 2679]
MEEAPTKTTVAVIGLGGMGIAAVKNLVEEGFQVTGFERNAYCGGLWHFTEDKTTLSILECKLMCYTDFPFPKDTPTHCSAKDVEKYIESYVERFQLAPHFRLNTSVTHISENEETGRWKVDIDGAPSEYFDKVVMATGPHVKPTTFHLDGQELFAGEVMHSQQFKRASDYAGKRVIVSGLGNTSADIANELVGVASEVYLSHSRGAHVLPRDLKGVPATSVLTHRLIRLQSTIDWLLPGLRDVISGRVLRGITRAVFGDLDPAWRLDDAPPATVTNPIINDLLIPNLRAGRLASVAGILRITSADTVELTDGSTVRADIIVCCVGYENSYCHVLDSRIDPTRYADPAWDAAPGARGRPLPRLYRNVFSLDRPDTLAFVGCAWFATGALTVADLTSMCIAQVWRGRSRLPPAREMERWMDAQAAYVAGLARRATIVPATVDMRAWLAWADETAGLGVERRVGRWFGSACWAFWWREHRLYNMIDRGVLTSAVWRLFEEGKRKAWDGARAEVERLNEKHEANLARYRERQAKS